MQIYSNFQFELLFTELTFAHLRALLISVTFSRGDCKIVKVSSSTGTCTSHLCSQAWHWYTFNLDIYIHTYSLSKSTCHTVTANLRHYISKEMNHSHSFEGTWLRVVWIGWPTNILKLTVEFWSNLFISCEKSLSLDPNHVVVTCFIPQLNI